MKHFLNHILLTIIATSLLTGCATFNNKLKSLLGHENEPEKQLAQATEHNPRFSEQENYHGGAQRQYKHTNREQFEQDAQLGSGAGSLWVNEGQGGYLFSQNNNRLIGDSLNINLDGSPKQQLQTKTKVIAKLLERLERQEAGPRRGLSSTGTAPAVPAPADPAAAPVPPAVPGQQAASQPGAAATPAAPGAPTTEKPNDKDAKFDVEQVPSRIVETLKDGSYRVKGSQVFMIGKREYKVIVTGIVKPDDFNEEGTAASKLLDSQFDIVSSKKGMASL